MEDTAAIYWCDMQGHVAASAGRNVTLLSEEWAEPVYVTYNLHHNRLDVREVRRGQGAAQKDEREHCLSYLRLIQTLVMLSYPKGDCRPGACLRFFLFFMKELTSFA